MVKIAAGRLSKKKSISNKDKRKLSKVFFGESPKENEGEEFKSVKEPKGWRRCSVLSVQQLGECN